MHEKRETTYPVQVPNPLIQPRRKHRIHVTKQAIPILDAQLLAQKTQHHAEARRGADFEHALFQHGRAADRVESDGDCNSHR